MGSLILNKLQKRINLFYNGYESKISTYSIFAGDNAKDVHPFLTFIKNNCMAGLNSFMISAFNRKVLYVRLGAETISIPFFCDGTILTKEQIDGLKVFIPKPYNRHEIVNIKEMVYVWHLLQEFSHREVFDILVGYIRIGRSYINLRTNRFG